MAVAQVKALREDDVQRYLSVVENVRGVLVLEFLESVVGKASEAQSYFRQQVFFV